MSESNPAAELDVAFLTEAANLPRDAGQDLMDVRHRPIRRRALLAAIATAPDDLERRHYAGAWRRRAREWYRHQFGEVAGDGDKVVSFDPFTLILISAALQIAIKIFFLWWERRHPTPAGVAELRQTLMEAEGASVESSRDGAA